MRGIWSAASFTEEGHVRYAALAGRQLFSMIFIIASAGHFNSQTIESAARHGVHSATSSPERSRSRIRPAMASICH
jgi:hypothetical protein